jgi:hypothetical protein
MNRRVRLVSQSSVHLPLLTVEGLRAIAFRAHYDPISRSDWTITLLSNSVTRACDPSGDNKGMGRWVDLIGPGSGWAIFWPAHSKLGVEAWASSEGSGLMSSRVGETALSSSHSSPNPLQNTPTRTHTHKDNVSFQNILLHDSSRGGVFSVGC